MRKRQLLSAMLTVLAAIAATLAIAACGGESKKGSEAISTSTTHSQGLQKKEKSKGGHY